MNTWNPSTQKIACLQHILPVANRFALRAGQVDLREIALSAKTLSGLTKSGQLTQQPTGLVGIYCYQRDDPEEHFPIKKFRRRMDNDEAYRVRYHEGQKRWVPAPRLVLVSWL